jgi:hypothetical protein
MILLLLIAAILPHDGTLRDNVDQIEVNHFFADDGKYVFSQLLFRDWSDHTERFQLRAWRMARPVVHPMPEDPLAGEVSEVAGFNVQLRPAISPSVALPKEINGRYVCHWFDGGHERIVTAPICKETYTLFDPELEDRAYLPKEKRAELRRFKAEAKGRE